MAPQAAIVWTAARGFARLARLLMPAGAARRPLLRPAAASVSASFSARPLAALSSSIPAAPSASEPSFSSSAVDAWTPPAPDAPSEAAPAAAGTAAAAPPASLRCDASGRVRLKALTYEQLERWVVSLDEKPSRAKMLWAEMYRDGTLAPSLEACASISASSRTRLAALATLDAGLALDSVRAAPDGTRKLLFRLEGGPAGLLEAVIIPGPGRVTLCVSSQLGCAQNCQARGRGGASRRGGDRQAARIFTYSRIRLLTVVIMRHLCLSGLFLRALWGGGGKPERQAFPSFSPPSAPYNASRPALSRDPPPLLPPPSVLRDGTAGASSKPWSGGHPRTGEPMAWGEEGGGCENQSQSL